MTPEIRNFLRQKKLSPARFSRLTAQKMVSLSAEECHRDFPEWQDPGDTSIPISIQEILAALGKTEDEVAYTESAIGAQKALQSLLRV